MTKKFEPDETRRSIAVLFGCLVEALDERDPGFRDAVTRKIDDAYAKVREPFQKGDPLYDTEIISWAREIVTGFNMSSGQGKPFLKK
jgi:hypothetical protein